MSNFNLKAKNKKTGKIMEFGAFDNYFGHHVYGYQKKIEDDNTIIHLGDVMDEKEFNDRFEVVEDKIGAKCHYNSMEIKPLDFTDPNHPYGGMEVLDDNILLGPSAGINQEDATLAFSSPTGDTSNLRTEDELDLMLYFGDKDMGKNNIIIGYNSTTTLSNIIIIGDDINIVDKHKLQGGLIIIHEKLYIGPRLFGENNELYYKIIEKK